MPTKRRTTVITMDPMIACPAAVLPAGREWIYEARVPGQRALIYKDAAAVSIRARGKSDLESRYPEVTLAAATIREERAVLDGVMVREADATARFYAMDVMWVDERDLRAAPLSERRERLRNIIANSGLRSIQVLDGSMMEAVRTATGVDQFFRPRRSVACRIAKVPQLHGR
jgi:ATP-dependent DNA ligase